LWIEKQPTVVLVTHDLREAIYLADTIYVFSRRPGTIISRTVVDLPRPRRIADTYSESFIAMTHALHEQIVTKVRA
jgi:NitT/TauT family transport system ATP-binding protein